MAVLSQALVGREQRALAPTEALMHGRVVGGEATHALGDHLELVVGWASEWLRE